MGALIVGALLAIGYGGVAAVMSRANPTTNQLPVQWGPAAPAWSERITPCVDGRDVGGDGCAPSAAAGEWPSGESLPLSRTGDLVLWQDGDPLTRVLAGATVWAGFITSGVVVLVLLPV